MKKLWALGVLALCATLSACTSSVRSEEAASPSASAEATPSATPSPTPTGCVEAPLTGLARGEGESGPIIGVKVENSPDARPQSGLTGADVVFVEMVEGGETRYLALYESTLPAAVGPVRSLRPTDAGILGQWSGKITLLYSGGIADFVTQVQNAGVNLMVEGDTGFFRDTSRWAPHNLYVALPEVASVLTGPGDCGTPLFSYRDDGSLPSGTVASQASVSYPAVWSTWTWNADTQRWDRADDGVSSTDASDGSAISATNVVVLSVEARNLDYTDVAGAPVPETVLEGEGRLDYFAGGQHMTGTWSKAGTNEPFVFTDDAGNTLQLVPGNTWVELLPSTGTLTVQ